MGETMVKICKHCRKEIDIKATRCPFCGGKQKSIKGKIVAGVIIVFVLAFLAIIGSSDAVIDDAMKAAQEMTIEDFDASCRDVTYEELKRNPDNYKGKAISTTVEIAQVIDDNYGMMRAYGDGNINKEYVLYDKRQSGDNIIENDELIIYGVYAGKETINRVIGGSDDIPCIYIIDAIFTQQTQNTAVDVITQTTEANTQATVANQPEQQVFSQEQATACLKEYWYSDSNDMNYISLEECYGDIWEENGNYIYEVRYLNAETTSDLLGQYLVTPDYTIYDSVMGDFLYQAYLN